MFKGGVILLLLIKGFIASGYFAFFHSKPKQIDIGLLHDSTAQAKEFNKFVMDNPSPELTSLINDLVWIINNEYQRDIRVKRIIHQDLQSLVKMSRLYNLLERPDSDSQIAYTQALATISDRMSKLRRTKDKKIREEILLLGELIEGNDR